MPLISIPVRPTGQLQERSSPPSPHIEEGILVVDSADHIDSSRKGRNDKAVSVLHGDLWDVTYSSAIWRKSQHDAPRGANLPQACKQLTFAVLGRGAAGQILGGTHR